MELSDNPAEIYLEMDTVSRAIVGAGIAGYALGTSHMVRSLVKTGSHLTLRAAWGGSNLIRIGTASSSIGLGSLTLGVIAGYGLGATVGTGISGLLYGKAGARDAIDFYTGGVGAGQYVTTVYRALRQL